MNRLFPAIGVLAFMALLLLQNQLFAWSVPVLIAEQPGKRLVKPVVQFSPAGKIYVVYEADAQIHLSSYAGSKVSFEKKISESTLLCYEPTMWINKQGYIHVAWIEATSYNSETQYVKYRFFNGSSWSGVTVLKALSISGSLPGGFVTRKVEDLRMAADENNNVFLAYMVQPAARCQFISKYGTTVRLEDWPMAGRSKHPDVAADAGFVHVTWQQLWDRNYTVAYCQRQNSANGKWGPVADVRDGIHRPRIAVDPNRVPHLYYMADEGNARNSIYKYRNPNGSFSQPYVVSDDAPRLYSNMDLGVADANNIFAMELATVQIFYNWKRNGVWSGHKMVDKALSRPDFTSCDLSPDKTTAVIAYNNDGDSIYIQTSSDSLPPGNIPPVAVITPSTVSGNLPLRVTFNASASHDADGQIVAYAWDFGDGTFGSGMVVEHVYSSKNLYHVKLTVTDNRGATGTAACDINVLQPNLPPKAVFTLSPVKGHSPLKVTFFAGKSQDSDGHIVTYHWDFGDGKAATGLLVEHVYTVKNFYKVTLTVTDDDGAKGTAAQVLEVLAPNAPPVALFTLSPETGLYPLTVTFQAGNSRDTDGTIASYTWDFGDGAAGSGVSPQHTYMSKNRYTIKLTVKDDDGATATATAQVEVQDIAPPLNKTFQRVTNRSLFSLEYLYHITWNSNPYNDAIGAKIAVYKIYRRPQGLGEYAYFASVPASSQSAYEYLDRTLKEQAINYEYLISAVDSAGRESPKT